MDDDHSLLEVELKRLRPVAPSRELLDRLENELSRERRKVFAGWAWLALTAAAAIAVICILKWPHAAPAVEKATVIAVPASPSVAFKPIHAENVLLNARDEGYVTLTDGTPARRVRQSYVDMITWKNPRTNASLTWSLPREEIRVVPVNFQ